MRDFVIFTFILLISISCTQTPAPEPVGPIPSERQLAWHQLEYYAFVHFNMNTFTNMEWGLGDEKPAQFNPTELDCRQWARVCKEAGMKGIILTAKHHDGFCLWPSTYTEHSVKNSPWKDGKGDVVRELADACKEYGLKLGLYLSPWDRNHADYGKPEYITYFRNQLRELLTNYGELFEVWFDGANGGTGYYGGANENRKIDRSTYYDWENTFKLVRELQPNACMFSDGGPDVRWVGNEEGWAGKTNWSILKRDDFAPGITEDRRDLQEGQEDGTHWLPAEVDVSIRPGWYYHTYEDHKVKTLPHLLDIYYHSVGRNASLLLNFPVDPRGLIHEKDVEQVLKLAEALKSDFAHDLAKGKKVTASNIRGNAKAFNAANVVDGDPESYWATDDGVNTASLTIDFGEPTPINRFLVQENILLGQRVQEFMLEGLIDNNWQTIANETTIGAKRILRLPNVVASQLKFTVLAAKACPVISNIQVYKAPKVLVGPDIKRDKDGLVTITGNDQGINLYYTTDGTEPDTSSNKFSKPFEVHKPSTVKAIVFDGESGMFSPVSTRKLDVSKAKWKVIGKLAKEKNISTVFDGDSHTGWRTKSALPVDFMVNLGETLNLQGFTYFPGQGRSSPGIILNYEFYTSLDGRNWKKAVQNGEFSNIKNSPILQEVTFAKQKARYIKLKALSPAFEDGHVGIAELGLITGS